MDESLANEDAGEVAYVLDEDAEEIIDIGANDDFNGTVNDDDDDYTDAGG